MSWEPTLSPKGGIFLPQLGWHLDARQRTDASFVSHAHRDHLGRHRTILCTAPTARLLAERLPGRRETIVLPFNEPWSLNSHTQATLYPAGHILGSAQCLLENQHGRLLYTGDLKLRASPCAEPCMAPPGGADVLIMETTFGKPRYRFPPAQEVAAAIVEFCRKAMSEHTVPVLLAYSLGKSQEALALLGEARLPVMLHPQAARLARIYAECGLSLPHYMALDPENALGHVVIAPPQADRSPEIRRIHRRRTALLSGWALDSWAVPSRRYDAAFPLSDHADYDELLGYVASVHPRLVYTVHGFATEFACDLRTRGIEAKALGRENQMELLFPD